MKSQKRNGFTLIEILVVIGIIAVLAAIVIVAINPARQFAQARNTQRISNVNTILNGVGQRIADNKGIFEGAVGAKTCPNLTTSGTNSLTAGNKYTILTNESVRDDALDTVGLGCLVPTYIPALPFDPSIATPAADTRYTISVNAEGRITISAPDAVTETAISNPAPTVEVTR